MEVKSQTKKKVDRDPDLLLLHRSDPNLLLDLNLLNDPNLLNDRDLPIDQDHLNAPHLTEVAVVASEAIAVDPENEGAPAESTDSESEVAVPSIEIVIHIIEIVITERTELQVNQKGADMSKEREQEGVAIKNEIVAALRPPTGEEIKNLYTRFLFNDSLPIAHSKNLF
jgi:hypothetical protein